MNKIIAGIIAVLVIAGPLFFIVCNQSSDTGEDVSNEIAESDETGSADLQEEETTEESTEEQEEESSEESTEEASSEEETTTEENTAEESSEVPVEEESTESENENAADNTDYTAAEQCIMSELTECEGIALDTQFQAYKDLVADGTLPQAPGSGCLECAVKYSFEAKYGESREIEGQPGEGAAENPANTGNIETLVTEYLFSLPGYYNDSSESTLNYLLPGSNAYNQITANKSSGNFRDQMTYSVYIETVEQVSETEYNVYAYREYSHENSGGVYEAYVRYNVVQQNGRYYISDYTELRNVPVQ